MHEEIGLANLLFLFRRRWIWLVISAALGFAALFFYSIYFITPQYASSVDLYVKNTPQTTIITDGVAVAGDLNASKRLADTCIVVLQNPDVLEQVAEELNHKVTAGQIRGALSMTSVAQTEVIRISAQTEDPVLSAEICNAVVAVAPEVLIRVVKAGSVEPIGKAKPAGAPSFPDIRRNALMGGLGGLALAVFIIVLIFMLDNTVKGEEDLAERFKSPILGEIPRLNGPSKGGAKKPSGNKHYYANTTQAFEAYKIVRANLLFTLSGAENNAIIITSAEPNAGKSTSCANLAISMALTGARVLILDADMRRPTLNKLFRVPNKTGLSRVLSGENQFEEIVHRDIVVQNMDLLTSGPIPPNPSELLGSGKMHSFFQNLLLQYDYIFVDTPPVNVVADALMLSPLTAGALFAARQKQTRYEELKKAIGVVEQLKSKVLGIIVTDVSWKHKPYGRYRGYNYSAYYYEKQKAE